MIISPGADSVKIVDPTNPIPKYLQISAWLKDLIKTGRYQEGEQLPSEMELARICDVNRNTLRQAIADLASQGILRREQGKGTFVASFEPVTVKHRLQRISSFGEDLSEIGIREKTKILAKGIEEAQDYVAKTLVLGSDKQVVAVRRLRTGDDMPLIYEESFLPCGMFENLLEMDLTGSMYQLITRRFNTVLARCEQSIRAVNLKGKIAKVLMQPENSAGLFMESVTYNEHNVAVEVLFSYYRGDKYVFGIELGRYLIQESQMDLLMDA